MAKPRLTAAAQTDIRAIRTYSRTAFGLEVAQNYIEGMRNTFHLLGERPRAGQRESDLGEEVRSFSYRSHRIFYRLDGNAVVVVRILHHAQDAVANLRRLQ